ncbi:MAG: hypothetical protein KAJ63_07730 [Methyloprofundus sp.]|nr:hypothetical protein [Methyloprofundus sp.]
MKDNKITVDVRINPDIQKTVETICLNIEKASALLDENKKLLSEVIKSSFQVVQAPLGTSQIITSEINSEST